MDMKFACQFFIAGGDATELLKPTKKALNEMAFAIGMLVIGMRFNTILGWGNHGLRTRSVDQCNKSVGIIGFVRDDLACLQACNEISSLRNIMHLTPGKQPAHWIAQSICRHMNLGAQPAARAADRLRAGFFWAPAAC